MNHKLADKNSGSDPEDIQLVTSAATLRLLGFAWNRAMWGCTGTMVNTISTYFTYTHTPAACRYSTVPISM